MGRCRENSHLTCRIKEPRAGWRTQVRIDHDAPWRATRDVVIWITHRQLRIIREHRAAAGHNRTGLGAQTLHICACRHAGDPLAATVGERSLAVQAQRDFDAHPRSTVGVSREKTAIQFARRIAHQTTLERDAGCIQPRSTPAGDARIGILNRINHVGDAGRDQRIDTRRSPPKMTTRFERHIDGRALGRLAGARQRNDLSMRPPRLRMKAFAHHAPVVHDHATDAGIRPRGIEAARRQAQGLRHMPMVLRAKHKTRSSPFAAGGGDEVACFPSPLAGEG